MIRKQVTKSSNNIMILELGEAGCISLHGPYIASDIVPGTGSHISSDTRPGGVYHYRYGTGGTQNYGGPISLLHMYAQYIIYLLYNHTQRILVLTIAGLDIEL